MRRLAMLLALLAACTWPQTARSAPGDIYVQFYGAQISWLDKEYAGHSFLCVVLHLNNGTKEECFGFYPKTDGVEMFIGTPGATRSEFAKNPTRFSRTTVTVEVKIDEAARRRILEQANQWNGRTYKLSDSNCIDFVHAALGATTLKRPDRQRFTFPTSYMQELKRLN